MAGKYYYAVLDKKKDLQFNIIGVPLIFKEEGRANRCAVANGEGYTVKPIKISELQKLLK